MKISKWEKAEDIFHVAVGLPDVERRSFLARECGGDRELLAEIESLVESFQETPKFLDEPVFEMGLGALHQTSQKNLTGETIGGYEIKEKIGAGGMGEVYKAFDTRLNRFVALKFLSDSLKSDASAKRQLIREARAAAALEHPNICTVYGFEQTADHHFIVMQFVEGQTLDDHFEGRAVSTEEFKRLARQILNAVAFAHEHGVLHRDLKPGNIMLTADGQIKILDFGLAKIEPAKNPAGGVEDLSRFSRAGLIVGTVGYMSPEQLRGERLDYRSDIFSVGVVFYKLLGVRNPFARASQAETIAAVLRENPVPLDEKRNDFPPRLLRIVERCLEKNKDARFQSAAEVLVEFDRAESEDYRPAKKPRAAALILKTVLASLALILIVSVYLWYGGTRRQITFAVLPIANSVAEKDYLADGLTQSVIEKLSKLSELKVKAEASVADYKGKIFDPETAGKQLNVEAVYVGSLQSLDGKLFLISKIVRSSDGFVIAEDRLPVDESDLNVLQESIAQTIVGKIKLELTDDEKNRLAGQDTIYPEAKILYFKGRHLLNRRAAGDVTNAVQLFTDAAEIDPGYAKAWAGLADAYLWLSTPGVDKAISPGDSVNRAKEAAQRAQFLDPTVSEAYNSLGLISLRYEWNWKDAEDNFRQAILRNPDFITPRMGLIGVLNIQGRFDEALAEAQKAKLVDPLSITVDLSIAEIFYRRREYDKADQVLTAMAEKYPANNRVFYMQSYVLLKTGRAEKAIEILEKMYSSDKESAKILASAPLGFAYAFSGRRDDALRIINNLDESTTTGFVPAQEKAVIYVGLGDHNKAFENLNKSCSEKFSGLPAILNDPLIENIVSDPRFAALRRCVKL